MILTDGKVFILESENLSYVFHVDETGLLLHDYFGNKIAVKDFDISAIKQKIGSAKGTSVIYKEEVDPALSMDYTNLEFSFPHKGDYRATPILLKNRANGFVFDFNFLDYEIKENPVKEMELPTPHNIKEELIISLIDENAKVKIELSYLLFDDDVIARNVTIINEAEEDLEVLKALSMSIDMMNNNYHSVHFTGGWAAEMNEQVNELKVGRLVHESLTGFSSHKCSPLFMIKEKNTDLDHGEVYIYNLIYSGNHIDEIELNSYNELRIQTGISPFSFNYLLKQKERFNTPYAVFTYSNKGFNRARKAMHHFVNNHIIPQEFKEVVRPLVINNWEGTYFNFNESKLLKIAKKASKYGVELFVLDDGWFSTRDNDQSGLGDYDVNTAKLPHGLKGLAKKINKLGMKFGLWFEPESINPISNLYEEHPEYAITNINHEPSLGRHQLLLDLTKEEVQNYIIDNVSKILSEANIEYVKWDMNRHMSDIPSINHNGEFYHRYIIGLYRVMKQLTKRFPHILFEGCASGGNRFDLGILSYFPQIWCSDNTDAYERMRIQRNLSYGFPLSTLSNHVSSCPNHQTLRNIPLDTRFNVSMFGVLGFELLFDELNKFERKRVAALINLYKERREILQFGEFEEVYSNAGYRFQVSDKNKEHALIMDFHGLQSITPKEDILKANNLSSEIEYTIKNFPIPHDIREFGGLINTMVPFHINPRGRLVDIIANFTDIPAEKDEYVASGDLLMNRGITLNSEWSASGINEMIRVYRDFGSRVYLIDKKE